MQMDNKAKFKNFLYYHKPHIFVASIVLIIFIVNLVQCAKKIDPDITVIFISESYVDVEEERALETQLAETGIVPDINEDGNIFVDVEYILNSPLDDTQIGGAVDQQIAAHLSVTDAVLFITNDDILYKNKYLDVFSNVTNIADDFKIPEEHRYLGESGAVIGISISGNSLFEKCGIDTSSAYLSLRENRLDETGDKADKVFSISEDMFKYILDYN